MSRTFVELLETLKLWCKAALGGGVDDEHDLALEVGQRKFIALLVFGLEVVECGGGRHGCCKSCALICQVNGMRHEEVLRCGVEEGKSGRHQVKSQVLSAESTLC